MKIKEFFKKILFFVLRGTGEPPKIEKEEIKTENQEIVVIKEKDMFDWMKIDWNNINSKISPNFKVHESVFLPSWRIYHIPSDNEKQEIVKLADKMEKIRSLFSVSISVHVWIRPVYVNNPTSAYHTQNYNKYVGSTSLKSAHIYGRAVDFHISGMVGPEGCSKARQIILPHLDEWDIRMEDIDGGWIHIDTNQVTTSRFFKP